MTNYCFLIFTCFLLIGCNYKNLPDNATIVSKYIVFDENISPELHVCTDKTIVSFKEKDDDCMFKLQDLVFEVEYIISLNKEGHMIMFDQHDVTEKINYKKFGIEMDKTDPDKLNGNDFWIRFSEDKKEIIDGIDTLKIEKIFTDDKAIFIEKRNEKRGRRFIYEYK